MTGASDTELEDWPDRLERVAREQCARFGRITVLRETDSTQSAARRMAARPGSIIVAGRQVCGRGRFGREWADTADHGIAATFVVAREPGERLAIVAAVSAAITAEHLLGRDVQIKWPNDLYAAGRKFGGALIEQRDEVAMIGIGMNISQTTWPLPLAMKAVSLHQLGATATRLGALTALIVSMDHALGTSELELEQQFARRDLLRGRWLTLRWNGQEFRGEVLEIQPLRGLRLRTDKGERWMPAAQTSILNIEPIHHDWPISGQEIAGFGEPAE